MKITVLCESISATQSIGFNFDQSKIPAKERIEFNLYCWSSLKTQSPELRNASLFNGDYLILSRWYRPKVITKLFDQARKYGKRVFLHLDDLLYKVPKSVGLDKYQFYNSKEMLDSLNYAAAMSDGLILSTPLLAQKITEFTPKGCKLHVYPIWKHFNSNKAHINSKNKRPYPTIGYMGSKSHVDDLNSIVECLYSLMHHNRLIHFETIGIEIPKRLLEDFPQRCSHIASVQSYRDFENILASRGWWIGLAPLEQNAFNYCKSDCKIVEYVEAGIPVFTNNFGPYEQVPSIHEKRAGIYLDEWETNLTNLIYSSKLRNNLYNNQIEYCSRYRDANQIVEFYKKL